MDRDMTAEILRGVTPVARQDNIASAGDWGKRARQLLEGANARDIARKEAERRSLQPTDIWPAGTFAIEPIPAEPDNLLYTIGHDPDLNRGLENLVSNAADAIFGRESGNTLIDYGTSNIPGIGAASILAAGGVPGALDVAGLGELKNAAKIPKYTLEFVAKYFGERGLKALDNAITKFPKAGKPSVNDAIYVLRTGIGGDKVPAIKPYSASHTAENVAGILGYDSPETLDRKMDEYIDWITRNGNDLEKEYARRAYNLARSGIENENLPAAMQGMGTLVSFVAGDAPRTKEFFNALDKSFKKGMTFSDLIKANSQKLVASPELAEQLRRYKELEESPVQNWESIVRKQELKDARDQAKAQRKHDEPAPREPEAVVTDAPAGGPNMWRENGWQPDEKYNGFYSQFGTNLSDDSKRDLFVVDSLKQHWVKQLGDNGGFASADILNGIDRARKRHELTNYNKVSENFTKDILANMASGNMPGTSVQFRQLYKNNVPKEGKDTPTLILGLEEKPKAIFNSRIWADEAEGPDLYEMLFRPAADHRLNSLNPRYWEYR